MIYRRGRPWRLGAYEGRALLLSGRPATPARPAAKIRADTRCTARNGTPGDTIAGHHRRIGQHHCPASLPATTHSQPVRCAARHDGGDLRLMPTSEEERHCRDCRKRPGLVRLIVLVEPVGVQHPHRHGEEGQLLCTAPQGQAESRHAAQGAGWRMVGQRIAKMPQTMGWGRRELRAAVRRRNNRVLSPIFRRATRPVETKEGFQIGRRGQSVR